MDLDYGEVLKLVDNHEYKTITKPPYYDRIKQTAIIISLKGKGKGKGNKKQQTSFRFVSMGEKYDILGEREYTFTLDKGDIDSIISQLEAVKDKLD